MNTKTPYENHKEWNHKTTWVSHNGIDKVEECAECLARFLHRGGVDEPPISLFAHIKKEVY